MRRKRCDCNGGLGGDGWATEKWRGDLVCKECKKRDQSIYDYDTEEKIKSPRETETMEKWIYKHYNKWVVKRQINNRLVYFGAFDNKSDAVKCRDKNLDLMNK